MQNEARTAGERPRDWWWRGFAARATMFVAALMALLAGALILLNAAETTRVAETALGRAALSEVERIGGEFEASGFAVERIDLTSRSVEFAYAYVVTPAGAIAAGERLLTDESASGVIRAQRALALPDGGLATLRIGVSLAPAAAAAWDVATRGLFAALAIIALALPALAIMADRIAAPIRDLSRTVARPGASGELERFAEERRDEVGALARAHLSMARDLAENADALHRLTFDDPVTKLPNRASLMSRLATALQLGRPVALLQIDVHGVARVAAGLGQSHGDDAVRRSAERLARTAAAWARVAGLKGDEAVLLARASDTAFALLVQNGSAASARALASAAFAAFDTPLSVGAHLVSASLSIGVALAPDDGDEAGALMTSAAAAASAAHTAGQGSMRFAGAELTRMAYGRLRLEQDLRRAIDGGEIDIFCQPQIALRGGGGVSGAEALVRWRHPLRGVVSPGEFIPLAEECGLIEPLGRLVLAKASALSADWSDRGLDLRIAVNVSPIEFLRPRFAQTTLAVIQAAGANPAQIELEITESAAMQDPVHAARELAPLKEAGVRIAIDDFGTGYSNLASLTRLPIDVLKVDRSFVKDAATEAGARIVVGAVIGLADNLGFETVAEGVETAEHLAFVTSQGATHVQGYLFGKPMPAPAFEAWRAERLIGELRGVAGRAIAGDRPAASAATGR